MTSSVVGGPRSPSGSPAPSRSPAPAAGPKPAQSRPLPNARDGFGAPVHTKPSPKPPEEHPFLQLRTELLRIASRVPMPSLDPDPEPSSGLWGVDDPIDLFLTPGALLELTEVKSRLATQGLPEPEQRTRQALEICDAVLELSERYPRQSLVDHLAEKDLRAASLYYLAGAAAASGGAVSRDRLAAIAGSAFVHIFQKAFEQHARITSQTFHHDVEELPRLGYVHEVAELAAMVPVMSASGASPKSVASAVQAARRAIGIKYMGLTPPELREQIYRRNQEKYGDPLGPTLPWLAGRGRTPTGIIEGGIRTDGGDLRQAFLRPKTAASAAESVK